MAKYCESCEEKLKTGETVLVVKYNKEEKYYCGYCYNRFEIFTDDEGEEIANENNASEKTFSPYKCCICDEMRNEVYKIEDKLYCSYHAKVKLGYERIDNLWYKDGKKYRFIEVHSEIGKYYYDEKEENDGNEIQD